MRAKYTGSRPDRVIMSVQNNEVSASIPRGTPVILSATGVAATDDGLDVVLPATAGNVNAYGLRYGVLTTTLLAGQNGESILFGVAPFALVTRATRAASSDSWTSSASIASGVALGIDTINNAFLIGASIAASIATNHIDAVLMDSIASFAASATATTDARTVLTSGQRVFVRMMQSGDSLIEKWVVQTIEPPSLTNPKLMKDKNSIPSVYSKKKDKIVVCTNSLSVSQFPAYSNHIQLFFHLGRFYKQFDFCLVNPPRMSIDRCKNLAAETALDIEAKYLLILDDDVLIPTPFDFLTKLINLKADIAAADVLIRGYPFNHMYFKYTNKDRSGLEPFKSLPKNHKRGSLDVDAVGFSCCLIKTDLLRQLPKPYFVTGMNNTEDIYFCVKAREAFPDCSIKVDTSIKCGHILWPEIIDSDNKKHYKTYQEKQFGFSVKKPKEKDDKGEFYLTVVKKQLGVK